MKIATLTTSPRGLSAHRVEGMVLFASINFQVRERWLHTQQYILLQTISVDTSHMFWLFYNLTRGQISLLELAREPSEVKTGMRVKPVFRRLSEDGPEGVIYYGRRPRSSRSRVEPRFSRSRRGRRSAQAPSPPEPIRPAPRCHPRSSR